MTGVQTCALPIYEDLLRDLARLIPVPLLVRHCSSPESVENRVAHNLGAASEQEVRKPDVTQVGIRLLFQVSWSRKHDCFNLQKQSQVRREDEASGAT